MSRLKNAFGNFKKGIMQANMTTFGLMECIQYYLNELEDAVDEEPASVTSLSDLDDVDIDDPESGDVLIHDGDKWINGQLAEVSYTGDYGDLVNTPAIPSKTSDLTNDEGFTSTSWNQIQTTGTKIAEISINGASTDVYAPTGGGGSYTAGDGIDITGSTISLEYLSVVSGKVCIVYDDGI